MKKLETNTKAQREATISAAKSGSAPSLKQSGYSKPTASGVKDYEKSGHAKATNPKS